MRNLPHLLTTLFIVFGSTLISEGRAQAAWLDTDWSHRLEIRADKDLIEGTTPFTDYTLLLWLDGTTHPGVFSNAKSDGTDLVVTSSDGTTVLGHEVVSFDATGQEAEIWFKTPSFSDPENLFYLYYGNPDTTVFLSQGAAWTNEHLAVYHFEEDPGEGVLADYGPNDNDATTGVLGSWTSSDVAPGQIGQGWRMDGTTHHIDGTGITSTAESYTISGWFACTNLEGHANFAFSSLDGNWRVSTKLVSYPDLATPAGSFRWQPAVPDTMIHHFVWEADAAADTAYFFFDGNEQALYTRSGSNLPVYTGSMIGGRVGIASPLFESNPVDRHEGTADEFKIYEGIRSPDWVKTEYNNEADPINFYSYVEQTAPVAVDPLRSALVRLRASPNPFRGVTEIEVDVGRADIEIAVYDIAGRRVRVLHPRGLTDGPLRLRWNGLDDQGRAVGKGIYFVHAIGRDVVAGTKVVLMQ